MVFTYESATKSRIAGLGNGDILAFLEQVPEKYRDKVFGGLRPISGFRTNEPRELKERIKRLARSLLQVGTGCGKGKEREWSVLGRVWAGWLQFTYKKCVDEALEKYQSEKLDFEAFLKLILSHENGNTLTQEDVGEIYRFSPFPSMDTISSLVLSLPTRAELAKQHEVKELKTRLFALEEKVEGIEQAQALPLQSDNHVTNEEIANLKVDLVNLSAEIQKAEKRCLVIEELGVSQNNVLGKALEALTHSNDNISKRLYSTESRVSALDKSNIEFIGAVRRIEGVIKALQKSVVKYDEERTLCKVPVITTIEGAPSSQILIERCCRPDSSTVTVLDTLSKLQLALASNYQAIGITNKASKKLAFTVAAAIASGQFTQFCGSLADIVADATMSAVSGNTVVAWDVPAGLCDGTSINLLLNEVTQSSQLTTGLLLRGFNKSAFDIYGYELKKLLMNRLLGISNQFTGLILVATALKSDACLPLGVSSLELGPIIDTSLLTWLRPQGEIIFGELHANEFNSEIEISIDTMLMTLANQIADMPISKSELWRRITKRARKTLGSFVDNDKSVDIDVAESLLINWVLPWITLQCTSLDELGLFIREHIHIVDEQSALGHTVEKYLANAE